MVQWIPSNTKFNIVGRAPVIGGFSVLLMLLSVLLWFVKGPNWGIDFLGGVNVHLKTNTSVTTESIRQVMSAEGLNEITVQEFQSDASKGFKEFGIKISSKSGTPEVLGPKLTKALPEKIIGSEILAIDTVGPSAGKDLRGKAMLAMLWSWVGIFLYLVIRFDVRYAPGAIASLIHDAVVTVGVLVLMGRELNISVMAAILTIIGYSVNDTVVVFDRIRERIKLNPEMSLSANINAAINETLSRTFLTITTVLLVSGSLIVFGKGAVDDIAVTLSIGLLVGTWSSVYMAAPIILLMDKWLKKGDSKGASVAA